ncbi:MAG TPA: LUD domain-containing protein [Longimicrobiales bacterium]|nr:LUD domain-containing protein [Longimicrobiales bacterium]
MSARERVLDAVRAALAGRARADHPGAFASWRPRPLRPPVEELAAMLERAGGEVVRQPDEDAAAEWLRAFAAGYGTVAVGRTVPEALRPPLPAAPPESAPLSVSMARAAVAETGSLLLDARDGRRTQLLPPTHVVLVRAADVHATLREALLAMSGDLPSALGLHSGPSKSADIGHVMVRGVHGPARLVAVVIGPGA